MARRVIWHVGLMKSGTTFVQGRLGANHGALVEHEVYFPDWPQQVRAVSDLMGMKRGMRDSDSGQWALLKQQVDAWPGTAVISMEFLGPARPERIATVLAQFPGAEQQVVVTLRDLARAVPAMWQESLKNRRTWTWQAYVDGLATETETGKHFWRQQAAARAVHHWATGIGSDACTVVTVPPKGGPAELLWDRFAEAAGLPTLEWLPHASTNASLGAGAAELMRRLNHATAELDATAYHRRVKPFANETLSSFRDLDEPIGFTVPGTLRERARRMVDRIRASGVRVVGDLRDLEPADVPGTDPATISADVQRDVAVAALAALARAHLDPEAGPSEQLSF